MTFTRSRTDAAGVEYETDLEIGASLVDGEQRITVVRVGPGSPPQLLINGEILGRDAPIITTAGHVADLAAKWALIVSRASDPTRRRKLVERNGEGVIVAVIDEAAS